MQKPIIQMTNQEYHASRTHLSSSNLKTLLKDPAQFYREWFLNERRTMSGPALDEGSFTHALCLEPETVERDYAFFQGLRKRGAAYEEFAAQHQGKIILSEPQRLRCLKYHEAYLGRAEAVKLTSGGFPEHSMVSEILGVPVKARADYININDGYIVDIKTTAYESGPEVFKHVIQEYSYHLSAALYCQIAHDNYGKLFDFYFVVISKQDLGCEIYKASSETLTSGAGQVTRALVLYKKCLDSGVWALEQPKKVTDSYEFHEV
jgi:exodeoxyribonuclease VIII